MTPDVITNLYGGLGNQLFQYAANLRALRETGGSSFELLMIEDFGSPYISDLIDVPFRTPNRGDRARWTELSVAPGLLRPAFVRSSRIYERRTKRFLLKQSEPFEGVRPMPANRQVKLEGFFQARDWFVDNWRVVAEQILERAPDGFEDLAGRGDTVISLRQRGDYVGAAWALPASHYDRVFSALADCGDAHRNVVVVSDVPAFVPWFEKVAAAAGFQVREPERLTGNKAIDDFWSIAAAATLAVSNSTFSWWAAAVASARGAGVRAFYPKPWVVNRWTQAPLPDMGLPGWTALPSDLPEFA